MSRHADMIRVALTMAETSTYRWKLGCVLTRGGRILSTAANKQRNPPHIDPDNATIHAEVAALKRCLLS